MDIGLGSLMGASGLGMGAGIVKQLATTAFQSWRANKQEKIEREKNRDALIAEKGGEFQKLLNEQPKLVDTDNEGKFNITLFSKVFGWEWKNKGHDVAKNDARSSRSVVIWMLTFTICAVTIIFAIDGLLPVWTTPANPEPSTSSWLWGLYTRVQNSTEIQILTQSGVAFLLVHGMLTVVNYWVVQVPFTYIRGRR